MFWLDEPKTWTFTSGGIQKHKTKTWRLGMIVMSFQDFKFQVKQISPTFSYFLIRSALLYQSVHFLASLLAPNKKITEKSVFRKAFKVLKWCHKHSHSPGFDLAVFYPTGSEISRFWYVKTRGKKITFEIFFAMLSSTLGRFYGAKTLSTFWLSRFSAIFSNMNKDADNFMALRKISVNNPILR